jgi:Domain of unknown function (DUF4189)
MWKTIPVLSVVTTSIIGFNYASAQAATVIAMDNRNVIYYSSRSSLNQARAAALNYCASEGGKGCSVIRTNSYSGFGAVAESSSRYGTAMGYETQAEANRAALRSCVSQMPANESCRITLQFLDNHVTRPTTPTGCINPATGLPTISGYCGGMDIGGNPYGGKLH